MRRYLRASICLIFSTSKFIFMKMMYGKRFKFNFLSLVSPFSEIEMGKNSSLTLGKMIRFRSWVKVKVRKNAKVKIGNYSSFNYGCMIMCHEEIIIGDNVQFGPNVLVYDHDHDFKRSEGLKDLKYKTTPVQIGNNVWVGANTIILRGTKIANNSVIGAGSVLKGEYPSNSIIIQKRDEQIIPY